MSFTIEIACADRLEAFAAIAPEVFDNTIDLAHLARFLADPRRLLLIAVADGQIVGQLTAFRHQHPDQRRDSMYIDEVGVSPGFWRRGIGTALLARALAEARSLGCDPAWVATEADNAAARALYRHAGNVLKNVVVYEFDGEP